MTQNKRSGNRRTPTPELDSASLVHPSVPSVVPDVEGGRPNTVEFRATYSPLRVEFHPWANSHPEIDEEYLFLYWNDVLVDKKTFSKPIEPEELFILVPVDKLIEGTHRLHYAVTLYNDTHVSSRPLDIYIDKTPPLLPTDDRLMLPDYVIREGVTEEYLAANGDKLVCTVPSYIGAEPGDVVKWFYSENGAGQEMVDMMTLTQEHIETLGPRGTSKPLELTFPGAFIRQSGNGTRYVRYEVQDRAGTQPQRALAVALESDLSLAPRELPPPRIKEATGSDYFSTLEPGNAFDGVTFVIPDNADIRPNETVTVFWGQPGTLGSYSTNTPISPGALEYLIPSLYVPPHMNGRVELYYQIDNPDVPPSPSHHVTVRKIEGLPIVQCSDIHNRALNLRTLGESTTFTLESWPFRHTSQFVNAWIDGVESGNVTREIRLPIATALPVSSETGVMVLGTVTKTELLRLAINYQFRVSVEVSFDDKLSWLKFPDAAAHLEDKP